MANPDNIFRRIFERLPLPPSLHGRRLVHQLARLRRKGRIHETLARFGHLAAHPVDGPYVAPYLADCLLQSEQPDLARVRMLMAVPAAPTAQAEYWSCRARVHHGLGEHAAALSAYTRALDDAVLRPTILTQALPLAASLAPSAEAMIFLEKAARYPSSRTLSLFHQGADAQLAADAAHQVRAVHSVSAGVARGHGHLLSLGEPEPIRLACLGADGSPAADRIILSYAPYVAELESATVVSGSSLVQVGDATVLSDLLADPEYARYVCLAGDPSVLAVRPGAVLVRRVEPTETLPEGINLSGMFSGHYGHWFAEFLPRLRHFIRHPRFAEVPIIVDEGMPASHYDFLAALVPNRQHILRRGSALKVARLWVAPTINFFPPDLLPGHAVPPDRQASWSAGALRFFAERLPAAPASPSTGPSRLFLSRRNSRWRRLVNEPEVVAALVPLGFRVVCLEDLGFAEQVRTLAAADFIIAPNGSALNNLIFARPSVKVVVLSQHHQHNWGGWLGPFRELGYDPVFVMGAPVQSAMEKHADYVIPAEEVRRAVERLLPPR